MADGSCRYRRVCCIFPQIAHQAVKRAFAVGEKHYSEILDTPIRSQFLFNNGGIWLPGINDILFTPFRQYPFVTKTIHILKGTLSGILSLSTAGIFSGLRGKPLHAEIFSSDRQAY